MCRVLAVFAVLLGVASFASPAHAQGSCPAIGWTYDIGCGDGQGCVQYYQTNECWGYGVSAGGETCACGGYSTCCGQQYVTYGKGTCFPGSQCAGCDKGGAKGEPARLASQSSKGKSVPSSRNRSGGGKPAHLAGSVASVASVIPTQSRARK